MDSVSHILCPGNDWESYADIGLPPIAPPLSAAERAVVKSFGSWTQFMQTYGLKPTDRDDIAQAKAIVQRMAQEDAKR